YPQHGKLEVDGTLTRAQGNPVTGETGVTPVLLVQNVTHDHVVDRDLKHLLAYRGNPESVGSVHSQPGYLVFLTMHDVSLKRHPSPKYVQHVLLPVSAYGRHGLRWVTVLWAATIAQPRVSAHAYSLPYTSVLPCLSKALTGKDACALI